MPASVNLFLVLNLGSEMLYVIDQRLRAQSIALDKSAQGRQAAFPFSPFQFIPPLINTFPPVFSAQRSLQRPAGQSIPGPADRDGVENGKAVNRSAIASPAGGHCLLLFDAPGSRVNGEAVGPDGRHLQVAAVCR